MRTAIDLPGALYREIKPKAALEGVAMKGLMERLVDAALSMPQAAPATRRNTLPTLSTGRPLAAASWSNADLFELADDGP